MTETTPADPSVPVAVLRARLADFDDLSPFISELSGDERARAAGYKAPEPRDVFILARGLLRLELSRLLNVPTKELHFDLRPSGKPDLRPIPAAVADWRFSVSHTGPQAVLAFAMGVDVGIDLERLDRSANPMAIARRYFTPRELAALQAMPSASQPEAFFAAWTRKEALVKARGQTMAESLATLSVDLDPSEDYPLHEDDPGVSHRPACRLASFASPEEKLIGAVAVCGGILPRLSLRILTQDSLRLAFARP